MKLLECDQGQTVIVAEIVLHPDGLTILNALETLTKTFVFGYFYSRPMFSSGQICVVDEEGEVSGISQKSLFLPLYRINSDVSYY